MELIYSKEHSYRPIVNSKIETQTSMIFKAQDLELRRNVCIKKTKIKGSRPREIDRGLERAMNEVRAMIELAGQTIFVPNIYSTYFDRKEATLYIIMEWIEGTSLREKMRVPPLQFIGWMIRLCDILTLMERRGLYHKDIKPENIMIDLNNYLFLIDFDISVSTPNLVEGTVDYKAPEMDSGSNYLGREKVDIFAIGVILYEYFTGQIPKRGSHYGRTRTRGSFQWDIFKEPREIKPEIHEGINEIILKAMKLDPKERFRDSRDLKRSLINAERGLRHGRARKRP